MSPTSLFPDPDSPVTPVARAEPPLWVRRVVLAAAPSPTATLLRDPIDFRPGLNIVRVAARPPGETRRIGNSVGKTLLTRLIRYSLGEAYFGTVKTVLTVSRLRHGACVLTEVRVGGETWVTCRPLRDTAIGQSFVVRTDNWQAALSSGAVRESFSTFLDAITTATLGPLPEWRIPGESRPPRWLDLLGWLARDQDCRFQHHNEWRDPEARSGTGRLDRDDASLLTAWVMGLLDTTEIREQQRRANWHDERNQAKAEADAHDRYLDSVRAGLCRRLQVSEETLDNGISEEAIREKVAATKRQIEAERSDTESQAGELQEAAMSAAVAVRVTETEVTRLTGMIESTRDELRSRREVSRAEYRATFDIYGNCPLDNTDCPKHPACTNSAPDPERESRINELQEHLARYNEGLNDCNTRLPKLRADADAARRRWQEADRSRREYLLGLGRADALADDYASYRSARSRRDKQLENMASLQRQISDSLEGRRAARGDRLRRLRELSAAFDQTMRTLIGPDTGGGVVLDARGLRPSPDTTSGASGAGLNTLAAVIGFDLSCLAAGITGVGFHPGFVIHDSPNNADIEDILYQRVFDRVRELEGWYGQTPVGFQYIVTTTTPPPATCDRVPFVRLTLDARTTDGKLLGVGW